jgi:ferredoxin-NADP reductase
MLTEPLTTPPTRKLQILYGLIVGIIFGSNFNLGPIYATPEVALVAGNIFSYLVSPKQKLFLKLKEKVQIAKDTYEFIFIPDKKINFKAGQYLEWTVDQIRTDTRGNRRYFTIASSPTEAEIRLGVRLSPGSSTFKQKLMDLDINEIVIASQLSGDFSLSNKAHGKMVFIAGGIGVTPFRSIVKYMIDKEDKRDVVMFYANKFEDDIAYKSIFDQAESKLKFKCVYVLTEKLHAPKEWNGEIGYLDENMIKKHIPDVKKCKYYLSGPQGMVNAYKELLLRIGVSRMNIITDYFPGF